MTEVRPRDNSESIDSMLKRFSKLIEASGIIQEVKARQAYVKPSEQRRKDIAAGKSRIRKQQRKMQQQIDFENENKFRPRRQPPRPQSNSSSQPPQDGQRKPYSAPQQRPPEKKPTPAPVSVSQESLKSLQEKFSK